MNQRIKKYLASAAAILLAVAFPLCALGENSNLGPSSAKPLSSSAHSLFETDLSTGSALANIPLSVPPGRNGIEPELTLSYSSNNSNGWCGMGWDLELGSIQRNTRKGSPNYDNTDTFIVSFKGNKFELVDIGSGEYRAKIESFFLKCSFDGTSWQVRDKDGSRYLFGSSPNSRQTNSWGTFKWSLDRIIDVYGNYLTVSYIHAAGEIYPSEIWYTGSEAQGDAPKFCIRFTLEDREDPQRSFRSASEIITARRLSEIEILVGGQIVRKYGLNYTYGSQTHRSLLTSLTQYGYGPSGQTSLPPITFRYTQAADIQLPEPTPVIGSGDNIWNVKVSSGNTFGQSGAYLYPSGTLSDGNTITLSDTFSELSGTEQGVSWLTDANGDFHCNGPQGSAFVAWAYLYVTAPKTIYFTFSQEQNPASFLNDQLVEARFSPAVELKKGFNKVAITGYFPDAAGAFDLGYAVVDAVGLMNSQMFSFSSPVGDFNGDGRVDMGTYESRTGSWEVALSTGEDFAAPVEWLSSFGDDVDSLPIGGDFNGDGLSDIGILKEWDDVAGMRDVLVALSDGGQFTPTGSAWEQMLTASNAGTSPITGDFDGDGLTDLAYRSAGAWIVYTSDGTQFDYQLDVIATAPYGYNYYTGDIYIPILGDFNGDGLSDIGIFNQGEDRGEWEINLANGHGFDGSYETWLSGFGAGKVPVIADFNNDGLTDVGYYDQEDGVWHMALSDGKKFQPAGVWLTNFGGQGLWAPQVGDFNGDGLTDAAILNPGSSGADRWVVAYAEGLAPDLLTELSNGIGGTVSITYTPSTEYNNSFLPFPVQTVSSVTRDDGLGHRYTTNYTYSLGYYDAPDREFRGFAYVQVNDPENNITRTWFYVSDTYKGKIAQQKISDSADNPYREVVNYWDDSVPYPGYPQVRFPYLAGKDKLTCDGDITCKQTRIDYTYDNYGNISSTVNYGEFAQGQDVGTDKRSTYNEYAYNQAEWIVNRLAHTYLLDNQGQKVSESWFYYDGQPNYTDIPLRGSLTKEEVWLNTNGQHLSTTYIYDKYGNQISLTDARGGTTVTSYEQVYHIYPENTTNALGQVESFTYEAVSGQLLTSKDVNNNTTRNEYDEFGRLVRVFGPDDDSTHPRLSYEYDLAGFPTKVTSYSREEQNQDAVLTKLTFYDGLNRVIQTKAQTEDPAKHLVAETVIYNSLGQLRRSWLPYFADYSEQYSAPDPAADKSVLKYDPLGRVKLTINADGTSNSTIYSDWISTLIDENGHSKRLHYDAYGNVVQVEEFEAAAVYVTSYTYDALDNLISITDVQDNLSTMLYDSLSRKIAMNDADMGSWSYSYDENGNLIAQADAKGQLLEFIYDALNRLTDKLADSQTIASYSYDEPTKPNCLGRLSKVTYPSGQTELFYDKLGREIKTVQTVDAASDTIQKTYDLMDRVTSITYPDGERVDYSYNKQGKIETVTGQVGYVLNVDYNASGQMTHVEYGNGIITDYTYDPQNLHLTKLSTLNQQQVQLQDLSYDFDAVGNITAITDAINTATQSFQYDDLNRLINAHGSNYRRLYQYDSIGNMLQKGSVTYTYGAGSAGPHAVTSATDGFSATYDANGNMLAKNETSYQYDAENRLISVDAPTPGSPTSIGLGLVPEWNFISIPLIPDSWELDSILSELTFQSDYDQVARYLPEEDSFDGYFHDTQFNQFRAAEYGRGYQIYITNPSGVNLSISGTPPTNTGITLASGWNLIGAPTTSQITVSEGLNNLTRNQDFDRIVKYNTSTKTFTDLSDSDTLQAGQSYFIHMLQPATWTLPFQFSSTTFAYNADGNRIKKVSPDSTTVYISDLYEVENSVTTKHIFLGANRICTVDSGPSTVDYYFYHQDHLGSTNLITNDQGSQTQLVEYLPFGEINLLSGTDLTDYKFTGKELDQSTGLYYYGARYYNPALSHFTQADPLIQDTSDPQTLNHYAYCRNNPLIYIDPTGMQLVSLSSFISDYSYGSYSDYSSYGYDRYSSYYTSSYNTTLNSVTTSAMLSMETIGTGLNNLFSFGYAWAAENDYIKDYRPSLLEKWFWRPTSERVEVWKWEKEFTRPYESIISAGYIGPVDVHWRSQLHYEQYGRWMWGFDEYKREWGYQWGIKTDITTGQVYPMGPYHMSTIIAIEPQKSPKP